MADPADRIYHREYFDSDDAYYAALPEHEQGECDGLCCPWCFSEQDRKDHDDG